MLICDLSLSHSLSSWTCKSYVLLKPWLIGSGEDIQTSFSFSTGSHFVEDVSQSVRLALQKDSSKQCLSKNQLRFACDLVVDITQIKFAKGKIKAKHKKNKRERNQPHKIPRARNYFPYSVWSLKRQLGTLCPGRERAKGTGIALFSRSSVGSSTKEKSPGNSLSHFPTLPPLHPPWNAWGGGRNKQWDGVQIRKKVETRFSEGKTQSATQWACERNLDSRNAESQGARLVQKEIRYELPGDRAAERSALFWAEHEEASGISGQKNKYRLEKVPREAAALIRGWLLALWRKMKGERQAGAAGEAGGPLYINSTLWW